MTLEIDLKYVFWVYKSQVKLFFRFFEWRHFRSLLFHGSWNQDRVSGQEEVLHPILAVPLHPRSLSPLVRMWEGQCVCVCVRERESVSVCDWESVCVCLSEIIESVSISLLFDDESTDLCFTLFLLLNPHQMKELNWKSGVNPNILLDG